MMTGVDEGEGNARAELVATVATFAPADGGEAADVARILDLITSVADPWSRSEPLHLTASALVVHAGSDRVLLRWHQKFRQFMQVGGHGDPGEWDPLAVALREGAEETGLPDLRPVERREPLVTGGLVQVVVVPVPAHAGEPAHEHADLRFLLETDRPAEARPETASAPIRWMSWDEARETVSKENLLVLLERARAMLS
jgi:8-oxo-dGTP pyrophosphatase MutT (NUDIX family)